MITRREEAWENAAFRVAEQMVTAAITAPKGHGLDSVDALVISGEDKDILADHMRDLAEETGEDFYARDASNVDKSQCVVIVAAMNRPAIVNHCSFCGFENCAENRRIGATCAFNSIDLGIAVGSAVSLAADNRIDTRVMFTAGKGALRMNLFKEDMYVCLGIPLSVSSKSVFFDRGAGDVKEYDAK